MIHQPVTPSNLRFIGYDPASRTLEIEFNSDAIYQYDSVPAAVHGGFMRAASSPGGACTSGTTRIKRGS
jgi:hypothetical protein